MANITEICTKCGKQFLIIENEQKFLNEKQLPFPKKCPKCRQERRLELRGSERNLYKTKCSLCSKDIVVSYNPQSTKNKILCREDYEKFLNENDCIINEPLPQI